MMRMEDDGNEIRWVGLEPADIHLLDQTSAKFADLLQRMVNKSLDSRQDYSDTPDPVKAMRDFQEFGVLVQEIESPLEMVSFMAYVMAALTKTGFQLEFMSVGMANILDNVIASMLDEKARQRFQELRRETVFSSGVNSFSDIKAEDLLKRLESYTTGTGKRVVGVHRGEDCEGFCVIHNPVSGPWDQWPTDWDKHNRIMNLICPHGVAHPCFEDIMRGHPSEHTCDGCPCPANEMEAKLREALGVPPLEEQDKDDDRS